MNNPSEGAGEECYLPRFHWSPLQGVVGLPKAMAGYLSGEIDWESRDVAAHPAPLYWETVDGQ